MAASWFSVRNYVVLSKMLGALLIRSFGRSERVYTGMLSRGYRGMVPFREFPKLNRRQMILRANVWIIPVLFLFIWDKW